VSGGPGNPAWVNDLAYTGAEAVEYLDSADSGYDGGAALVDFWSSMKSSMYNTFVTKPPAQDGAEKAQEAQQVERQRAPPQHGDTCWGLRRGGHR